MLKAIPPIAADRLVRGQFRGYRQESGRGADSKVETFAALRLRDQFLALEGRAVLHPRGKESARHLHGSGGPVPQAARRYIGEPALTRNHLRFRISPEMTIALGATVHG